MVSDLTPVPASRPRVHVEGVVKSFAGRVVVDVADLTLGSHPVEGLIGPNGAGKTTLMRLIMHSLRSIEGRSPSWPGDGSSREVVLSSRRCMPSPGWGW
jgi:ABC-type uncharacterized transport system ATPase subunit